MYCNWSRSKQRILSLPGRWAHCLCYCSSQKSAYTFCINSVRLFLIIFLGCSFRIGLEGMATRGSYNPKDERIKNFTFLKKLSFPDSKKHNLLCKCCLLPYYVLWFKFYENGRDGVDLIWCDCVVLYRCVHKTFRAWIHTIVKTQAVDGILAILCKPGAVLRSCSAIQ